MRRCCHNRRRRCRRPPLRVHIGDQPFQVKQLAYETDFEDDWCGHPWGNDGCDSCSPPPPPWFDENDFQPPIPPPPPGGIEPREELLDPEIGETGMDDAPQDGTDAFFQPGGIEDFGGMRPPRPGPCPWPPHHWPPRPRNCNGCNLKIKVFKFDACHNPIADVVMGIYFQGRLIRTAETNERGEAVFSYLPPGLYTVREIEVPEGVEEDDTRFAVYLSHACTSAIVVFRKGRCRVKCPDMGRWWPTNPHHQ